MSIFACDNSQSIHQLSASSYKTEAALQAAVIAALYAAVASSAFTASVAVNTYSTQDVNNVMRTLNEAFFICNLSGNNLVISW